MQKWIAKAFFLPYILINLFPVIFSYAEKSFSDALEMLRSVFERFSIYFIQQRFCFDSFRHQSLSVPGRGLEDISIDNEKFS